MRLGAILILLATTLLASAAQAWQLEPAVSYSRAGDSDYTIRSAYGTVSDKQKATAEDFVLALRAILPVSSRVDLRPRLAYVEMRDQSDQSTQQIGWATLDQYRSAWTIDFAVRIRLGKDAERKPESED